jgi:hypothetical protein
MHYTRRSALAATVLTALFWQTHGPWRYSDVIKKRYGLPTWVSTNVFNTHPA